MNAGSNDDCSRAAQDAQRHRKLAYASSLIDSFSYGVEGPPTHEGPAPQRTPISAEEMDSLMTLLRGFRTRLLWLHCEWAEEARQRRLSPAELEPKAATVFAKLREQFVAHLMATLDTSPAPIVVEPPLADDRPPSALGSR